MTATAPTGPSAPDRQGPSHTASVAITVMPAPTNPNPRPGALDRHHGTMSASIAAGIDTADATRSHSTTRTTRRDTGRPYGSADRRARRSNGMAAISSSVSAPAYSAKYQSATPCRTAAWWSVSASRAIAAVGSAGRSPSCCACAPTNSFVGPGPPRAARAVGARSTTWTYPDRAVLVDVSQPPAYPGPSAIATCKRDEVSVSDRPATSTSELDGRAASTRARF